MPESPESSLAQTLEEADAAMRKGKTGMLVGMTIAGIVIIVGAIALLSGGDEQRVYGDLGKQINGIRQEHFDQFWGCAMQGTNLGNVRSNADLISQIDVRSRDRGKAYATYVRNKCMPMLEDIAPKLDALIAPADLQPHIAGMVEAIGQMRATWDGFLRAMEAKDAEYDAETARPQLQRISRGWYDFKKAHGAANDVIRKKLE